MMTGFVKFDHVHFFFFSFFFWLGDSLGGHNGWKFTTKDQDNDTYNGNCAKLYYGAWWYGGCHATNLNGLYASSALKDAKYNTWAGWKNEHEALKKTLMMIRPA